MADERNTDDTTVPMKLPDDVVEKLIAAAKQQIDDYEREPRDLETREEEEKYDTFVPPQVLPDPKPQHGYVFRWVRTGTLGSPDNMNVSMRFREGWVPVRTEDHLELNLRVDEDGRWAKDGLVEVGGLLLCKMSAEKARSREGYYKTLAARQMESVDETFLRNEDRRMPLLAPERRSRTQFGRDS